MLPWTFMLTLGLALTGSGEAPPPSPGELEDLKGRVQALEESLKRKDSFPGPSKVGSLESTASGVSRFFNPALSVNGLFLATFRSVENGNRQAETRTGFDVQEVEVQLSATVDNYLRGSLTLSLEELDTVEIEETTVDVLVTRDLSFRGGKWFIPFGKHNQLHTHQFPFIDAPLVNAEIFGEESLNEIGVGLSYLTPLPWYSELLVGIVEGDNSSAFNGPLNDDFAYFLHHKNLWDLNEETTLEFGGSFAYGRNDSGGRNSGSHITGGNLTLKWIPARQARYRQLEIQTEYLHSHRETGMDGATGRNNPDDAKGGLYAHLKYKFAQTWWIQGRYGLFGVPSPGAGQEKHRLSGLLAWTPTEFSAVRLQYNYLNARARDEHQAFLQLNFTMGSHPAHRY